MCLVFLVSFENIWALDASSAEVTEFRFQGSMKVTKVSSSQEFIHFDSEIWIEFECDTITGLVSLSPLYIFTFLAGLRMEACQDHALEMVAWPPVLHPRGHPWPFLVRFGSNLDATTQYLLNNREQGQLSYLNNHD